MAKHTPGPWRAGNPHDTIVADICPEGCTHWDEDCRDYYGGYVIAEAVTSENKPLIIAAPDLLAVCELMLDFYNMHPAEFVDKYGGGITTRTLADKARAAIAKARGREATRESWERECAALHAALADSAGAEFLALARELLAEAPVCAGYPDDCFECEGENSPCQATAERRAELHRRARAVGITEAPA